MSILKQVQLKWTFTPDNTIAFMPRSGSVVVDIERRKIKPPKIKSITNLTYNGQQQSVELEGFDDNTMILSGNNYATNSGSYSIIVSPKYGYEWEDETLSAKNLNWSINKADPVIEETGDIQFMHGDYLSDIDFPLYTETNGDFMWITTDDEFEEMSAPYKVKWRFIPDDINNYNEVNGEIILEVFQIKLAVPTQKNQLIANGQVQSPTWNNYDSNKLNLAITPTKSAGEYNATFSIKDTNTYLWNDGTTTPKTIKWSIEYCPITLDSSTTGIFNYTITDGNLIVPSTFTGTDGVDYIITELGQHAFYNLSDLKSITIPESVEFINKKAFDYSDNLESINIDVNNYSYSSVDGVVFDGQGGYLELFPRGKSGEYTIPDGVFAIEENAFYNCNRVTSITAPDSLSVISNEAFYMCSGLTFINFPNGLREIGDNAFYACIGLTALYLPSSLKTIGDQAFFMCSNVTTLSISNGSNTLTLGTSIFRDCYKLKTATINAYITKLTTQMFDGCKALTTLTIPSTVNAIEENALNECDKLTTINFRGSAGSWSLIDIDSSNDTILYSVNVVYDYKG